MGGQQKKRTPTSKSGGPAGQKATSASSSGKGQKPSSACGGPVEQKATDVSSTGKSAAAQGPAEQKPTSAGDIRVEEKAADASSMGKSEATKDSAEVKPSCAGHDRFEEKATDASSTGEGPVPVQQKATDASPTGKGPAEQKPSSSGSGSMEQKVEMSDSTSQGTAEKRPTTPAAKVASIEGVPLQTSRTAELRARAAELRSKLAQVEAAIEEEQAKLCLASYTSSEDPVHLHKRPSWSIMGGSEGAAPGVIRELSHEDEDFASVWYDHPELKIEPIGAYNHWDRRECAVVNAEEWRARCDRYMKDLDGKADIPKVIHQIWIGPREPPCLWIDTFRVDYCEAHPSWGFKMWSDEQVAQLPMINGQIYHEESMWQCKADILRLEFLWHYGGVYVDADMISVGMKSLDPIVELGKETGFVIAYEPDTKDKPYSILGNSVIACTPHHPLTLMLILFLKQTYYQKRHHIDVFAVTGPVMYTKCLIDCNMPISIAAQELLYPAFHFVPNPDAIDYSQFPKCLISIGLAYLMDFAQCPAGSPDYGLPLEDGVGTVITDGDFVQMHRLRDALPGLIDSLRYKAWDVLLFGIEWSTGSDEVALFNVPPGGRPRNSNCVGVVINVERSHKKEIVRTVLSACIGEKGFDPAPLFNAADRLSLWFAADKLPGTIEEARIWKSMPLVHRIFSQIAGHNPPLHFDDHELHGNLVKGKLHGRMAFEMVVESNGAIMFRAWNDDNSPNCEMKTNGSKVEW
eukprot:CAMPEP_0115487882 /NCGR_PEP_ID=MMETSP0271-20121206/61183_1 /TAXON_ID=71861 /ORGANISM="Scrippsiella trochoidea, Strain CCMP3099" /LENGTH=744 /DNA_ID=CAMNT_0002915943 /DNA_START=60 /DNA_END=2292 /DNA_ORIENTATION=+